MMTQYQYVVAAGIGVLGVILIVEFIYPSLSTERQRARAKSILLCLMIAFFGLVTFAFALDEGYIGTSIGVATLVWLWVSLRRRRKRRELVEEDDVRPFGSAVPNTKRYRILVLILAAVIILVSVVALVR